MDFYVNMNEQSKNWDKELQCEDLVLGTEISPWQFQIRHEFNLRDQPSYRIDSHKRLTNQENNAVPTIKTKSPLKCSDHNFGCSRYSQYWAQIRQTLQKKQNRNQRNQLKATICKGKIVECPGAKTRKKPRNHRLVPSWFQTTFFLSNNAKITTSKQKIVGRQNQAKLPIISQYNLFRK